MQYSQKWCKKVLSSFSVSPKLGLSKLCFEKGYLKLIPVWYWLVTVKLITLINWNHPQTKSEFDLGHMCLANEVWMFPFLSDEYSMPLKQTGSVWECVSMCICVHIGRGNGMGRGRWDRELGMGMEKAFWSMFIMHQRKRVVGGSESNSRVLGLTVWNKQGDAALWSLSLLTTSVHPLCLRRASSKTEREKENEWVRYIRAKYGEL